MAEYREVTRSRSIAGTIPHGKDLLAELTSVCAREKVKLARIEATGAVQHARLGCYNQQELEYEFIEVEGPHEIASLVGTVSFDEAERELAVNAHVVLADRKGAVVAGRLEAGTIVFACEFVIEELVPPDAAEFVRRRDGKTGLGLWRL